MDAARLHAAFPKESWQRLLARLRARLQVDPKWRGTITLRDANAVEHAAWRRLFGTSTWRDATALRLDAKKLEVLLQDAGLCASLTEAIEHLTGPLPNRLKTAQKQQMWQCLLDEAFEGAPAWADAWREHMQRTGQLRRLAGGDPHAARRLVRQTVAIAHALPGHDTPLTELAAATVGDSHALDLGEPLGTLCLRLAKVYAGDQEARGSRRAIWAAAGIVTDELSAPVLVLNLPAAGCSLSDRTLQIHAQAGEPCRLSVRTLLRHPPTLDCAPCVFVCENPSVTLAAANKLGALCSPLVCTEGQPKTASRLLLDAFSRRGVPLLYHGDFDWDGLRIANLLQRCHGVRPWRMGTRDYLAAAKDGRKLSGAPTAALWDANLSLAMQRVGQSVHEEATLAVLLSDLSGATR